MREIRRFGSFKLLMFCQDETRRTYMSKVPILLAKIRISNGDLLAGEAPNKVSKQARRWVEGHRAELLWRIAEEQQPIRGADFARWRVSLGLSLSEAAKLLGVGRRTIMGYLNKDELPSIVAIACRALARDKHLLAARYVPARKIARPAA